MRTASAVRFALIDNVDAERTWLSRATPATRELSVLMFGPMTGGKGAILARREYRVWTVLLALGL
jgi:hypothetical protein